MFSSVLIGLRTAAETGEVPSQEGSLYCGTRCLLTSLLITGMFYSNFHKQTFALDNGKEPWSILRAHSSATDPENGRIYKAKRHLLFKQSHKGWRSSGHWKGHCLSFQRLRSRLDETQITSAPAQPDGFTTWHGWEMCLTSLGARAERQIIPERGF